MKYIITEEQNTFLSYRRRMKSVHSTIRELVSYVYPCGYKSYDRFLVGLREDFFLYMNANWLDSKDEDKLWDLIMLNMGDELKSHYKEECNK